MAGFNVNQGGGAHGQAFGAPSPSLSDLGAANTSRSDETDPTKVRAGRGYDTYQNQVTSAGHPVAGSPHFGANAGPYGVYLNQLDTRGQAAMTPLQQAARGTALGALQQGPQANDALNRASQDQLAARQQQIQAQRALGSAGAANAATQQGLAAWGSGQASGDSGLQAGLAAGAMGSDAASAGFQGNALGMYQNAAMGKGPSAAQAVLSQATANNVATQRALAAGARGGSAAAAMRGANQAGVQLGLQAQAQASALRAQEQQAGMAGLANTSAQARAGDVQRYGMGADILSGKRAADMGAVGTIGGLASQGRAQDIGQAGMQADYLGNVRGQDIQGGAALGGVENQNLAINNQQQQAAMAAAFDAEKLRQAGIAGANETNLGAGNLVSGNYLQGRNITLQHDAQQDAQFANTLGALAGGGGALFQAGMPYMFGPPGGAGGGGGMGNLGAQGRAYFGESPVG
jgi:hypothetical protein